MKAFAQLCFLLFSIYLNAQNNQVQGIITYQSSGERPEPLVSVTAAGAGSSVSKDNGLFVLSFPNSKPGDLVRLIVQKEGYRVVGPDPLIVEAAIRSRATDLVRIVVVKTGEYERRVDDYLAVFAERIREQTAEIDRLRSEMEGQSLAPTERALLLKEIERLKGQLVQLEGEKQALAESLASINLDDASELAREALQRFEKGDLQAGLDWLSAEKLEELRRRALAEKERAERAMAKVANTFLVKAQLLQADLQLEEALEHYRQAHELDPGNADITRNYMHCCRIVNRFAEGIEAGQGLLPQFHHPFDSVDLLVHLAGMHLQLDEIRQAEEKLNTAASTLGRLVAQDTSYLFTRPSFGLLDFMTDLYVQQDKLVDAEQAAGAALAIAERLCQKAPEAHGDLLALAYWNYASLTSDPQESVDQYRKALQQLEGPLTGVSAGWLSYSRSKLCFSIAQQLTYLDRFDEALQWAQKAEGHLQPLRQGNPYSYEGEVLAYRLSLAILIARQQSNEAEVLVQIQDDLEAFRQYVHRYPGPYDGDLASLLMMIGQMYYYDLKDSESAMPVLMEAEAIFARLLEEQPGKATYTAIYVLTTFPMAMISLSDGNDEDANKWFSKSREKIRHVLRKKSEPYLTSLLVSSLINHSLGKARQALQWGEEYPLTEGKAMLREAEELLAAHPEDEGVQFWRLSYEDVRELIYSFSPENIHARHLCREADSLQALIFATDDPAIGVRWGEAGVEKLEQALNIYPETECAPMRLPQFLGNLAWSYLLVRRPADAQAAAEKALAADPTQEWIKTNLAHSLLLQGKWKQARPVYEELSEKPFDDTQTFGDILLQDLNALEEKGIAHPDFRKVRQLLGDD
ncbi:MAG: hypothetical protein KDC30_11725 [Saprospiraceae bacterium]|nr:hypothetical protein [Saprospiraceae bacterium]